MTLFILILENYKYLTKKKIIFKMLKRFLTIQELNK